MRYMKSAVLIHGLHVQAHGWEELVWGSLEEGLWGTIVRGVEYAWRTDATLLYWGSGASERDGKKEAELMYARALSGSTELAKICDTTPEALTAFLEERSFLDTTAKDTTGEIKGLLDRCLRDGITDVVLVPYASQAPIAVRRALLLPLEDATYASFRHHIHIEPSDTRYPGVSMKDIVIFTPPHRGDRVKNPSHVLARTTLDVIQTLSKSGDAQSVERFLQEWEELLARHSNNT